MMILARRPPALSCAVPLVLLLSVMENVGAVGRRSQRYLPNLKWTIHTKPPEDFERVELKSPFLLIS